MSDQKTEIENRLEWFEIRGCANQCALSCLGDFVISHRTQCFTLSYRPKGIHVHIDTYRTLTEAKQEAERLSEGL